MMANNRMNKATATGTCATNGNKIENWIQNKMTDFRKVGTKVGTQIGAQLGFRTS